MNWFVTLMLGRGRPYSDLAGLRRASEATRKAWAEARMQDRGTAGRA